MAEEALLGALESRAGRGLCLPVQCAVTAGDVGRFHGRIEVVVDDHEGFGISIIDAALLGRQLVLEQFILDTVIGKGTRSIETKRLQIAG